MVSRVPDDLPQPPPQSPQAPSSSDATKAQSRKRPTLAQVSTIVGLFASIATVLALFQPFGGGGSSEVSQKSAGAPGESSHSSPEQMLIQHVPQVIRPSCSPSTLPGAGSSSLATVACTFFGTHPAYYALFDSERSLREFLYRDGHDRRASCGAQCCASEWNVLSSFRTPAGENVGEFKCYTAKPNEWIEWARYDLHIYAALSAPIGDRRSLYKSWLNAGPV